MSGNTIKDGFVSGDVRIVSLGREAMFFIPTAKLSQVFDTRRVGGYTQCVIVEEYIQQHLRETYLYVSTRLALGFEVCRNNEVIISSDVYMEYRVAIQSFEDRKKLQAWLGKLLVILQEKFIVFEIEGVRYLLSSP